MKARTGYSILLALFLTASGTAVAQSTPSTGGTSANAGNTSASNASPVQAKNDQETSAAQPRQTTVAPRGPTNPTAAPVQSGPSESALQNHTTAVPAQSATDPKKPTNPTAIADPIPNSALDLAPGRAATRPPGQGGPIPGQNKKEQETGSSTNTGTTSKSRTGGDEPKTDRQAPR